MKNKEKNISIRITDDAHANIKKKAEIKKISITEYIQNYKFKTR